MGRGNIFKGVKSIDFYHRFNSEEPYYEYLKSNGKTTMYARSVKTFITVKAAFLILVIVPDVSTMKVQQLEQCLTSANFPLNRHST